MIAKLPNCKPSRPTSDAVTRMRLIRLQHSEDPQAAAIATGMTLLLSRIDRLLEMLGGVA